MGSLGTEWETADTFSDTRLNQKTQAIGNSNQLNLITTTYPGQAIYPLDAGNGSLADRPDSRDAANTKWHYPQLRVGSVGRIGENPGVETNLGGTSILNAAMYVGTFTLPTTEKFYKITEVSGAGGSASGTTTLQSGIDIFDTTTKFSLNVALTTKEDRTASAAINFTYFNRCLIPGGSTCVVWISNTSSVTTFTLGLRTSGTNATSWSTFTGAPTTPYTGQATPPTLSNTFTNMNFVVSYQGYY